MIWDDPKLKAYDSPSYCYLRISINALGQILQFGQATQFLVWQDAPVAKSILFITNLNDHVVDNTVTKKVVTLWCEHGTDVQTYQFPADLHLEHSLFDMTNPDADVVLMVYTKLLELIDK